MTNNQKYHISLRIIHWIMALIIISLIALGIYMESLDDTVSYRFTLYNLHKSFGVIALFLIFIRIITRFSTTIPDLPKTMSKIVVKSAHFVHYLLYLLMIIMPISGYLMSNYFGYSVKLFSISLPNLVNKNPEIGKLFAEIHEIAGYALIAVIILHIAGAIKHRFFDKKEHDVLPRML